MTEPRRAFRLRLSLRALMVLVLVVGVWGGWRVNRARSQREAVATILAAHGQIHYDFQCSADGMYMPRLRVEHPGPKWFRKWLGDEFFQEVALVELTNPDISGEVLSALAKLDRVSSVEIYSMTIADVLASLRSPGRLKSARLVSRSLAGLEGLGLDDRVMAELARFPHLRTLHLQTGKLTDAGMAHLAGLRELQSITLIRLPEVTDAGLIPLANLPELRKLELDGLPKLADLGLKNLGQSLANLESLHYHAKLTERGMAPLETCLALKDLDLSVAKVTDAGLAHLRNLKTLESLRIYADGVTDEGLATLAGFPKLKVLSINYARVTGAGLDRLSGLTHLETLSLVFSTIADPDLIPLRKLTGLKKLDIRGTSVSPGASGALEAAMPGLSVEANLPPQPPTLPSSPANPAPKAPG